MVCLMALSLLIWPFGPGVIGIGLVTDPLGLRLLLLELGAAGPAGAAAPALASALLALNTSAIYLGQAAGAASGGWLIAHGGYARAAAGSAWPG